MAKTTSRVLAEDIYSALKDDILNAVLRPGTMLDEMQLMQRFDVSRTPIREVIRKLAADGLVGMEPHRSAYVNTFTVQDIADFFEAFRLTQRLVMVLSAARINRSQLDDILKLEQRLESACDTKKVRLARELNIQFHLNVAAGCSNKYLQESYGRLLEQSTRLSSLTFRLIVDRDWNLHSALILRNHNDIIDALVKRDCERIAALSDEHIAIFKKRVYEALDKDVPVAAVFSPV
ncbi:MAG TPA: GntR family transcriptional regulator [Woeseiaceae bacterium]|jgi:DNA-binding GntR family transcriptional regulator|nr:GntR family transcriptional regulator [Woeseiaceae bacterium]